ncbi:bifunctional DNA-formamidopyrimidine glycosylase/DNA-(apurinic or apyrimidinic site) lyase [Halocynthiibacter namhaensis]|uniref:bifunctional DNA-formamidopyrimidine glycosylase/DNA-(apurinic or apyrimidinic site) lyase n=1 Tax=Halocynthiibacter namhaensis TaxID=1290553 RepID=UPI000578FC28|nr:bifunctional DNA-formamidopyrimidine glycosylase/DNA-(apurinic or apyrimidinic site) lyase [Halocynthiibacter namhaensis]
MPELPEVETVRRGLLPAMEGEMIEQAEVRREGLRWPFPDNMADRLTGAGVKALRRRSKYILADLDTDETLIIHLGMSGRMQVSGVKIGGFYHDHQPEQKHDHVVLHMSGGGRVTFNDARRFGAMDLAPSDAVDQHKMLVGLGPEPLGNDFHEDLLSERFKGRKTPVKSALLDQKIVAGLGNIYVCEVLNRVGISPRRSVGEINATEIGLLVPAIREVLSEAIEAGGSSLKDYRQADGELGYFQHSFKVYGREGEACQTPDCRGEIGRITQAGRSSFFCAQCQR